MCSVRSSERRTKRKPKPPDYWAGANVDSPQPIAVDAPPMLALL